MDNLKLSYVDEEVLEKYVEMLKDRFRTKFQELTVKWSDMYDYLGLYLNYTDRKDHYVKLKMYDCLKDILNEVNE